MSWGWKPYVPVAKRRARAQKYAEKLAKEGRKLQPIEIDGRAIARTFWGNAWCENLESYSDFANRLPRGRTYVRNGSVLDLQLKSGKVEAIVSGSEIYNVKIEIAPLPKPDWKKITRDCARTIDSLMDLLEGRLSQGVMERLTRQKDGLFPQPKEIKIRCSCPDWATLCKHAAAVLYGVGARLDAEPELLFVLRKVDHLDLIERATEGANLDAAFGPDQAAALGGEDLGELFGIDLDGATEPREPGAATPRRRKRSARTRAASPGSKAEAAASSKPKRGRGKAAVDKKAPATRKKISTSKQVPKAAAKKKGTASRKPVSAKAKAKTRRTKE